ncbi:5-formyltetrahydrofolate cyclo-ligase [Roseivivax sp. CAU 1761]
MQDDETGGETGGEPPCFGARVIAGHAIDPVRLRDVTRFRRAERARLYAARKERSSEALRCASKEIADGLDRALGPARGRVIAVYWPIRGEPDLRGWMRRRAEAGDRVALPVIVETEAPLRFRAWHPGAPMTRGIWSIPIPEEGAELVPEVVVSPLLGVDAEGYRLGNGGGYYDRTLAAMTPRPRILGVGYAAARIATIHPMPWDVAMDEVILAGE